jgi:hypothetical protein
MKPWRNYLNDVWAAYWLAGAICVLSYKVTQTILSNWTGATELVRWLTLR